MPKQPESEFRQKIELLMAHCCDIELPWHRVVNRFGGLAAGYHGGREAQAEHLQAEGVTCTDFIIDHFKEIRWQKS